MSREIKFRAWDIVGQRMKANDELWDIPFNELFINTPDSRPYNLMQYTGLKDKNGVEIYEGDIIRSYNDLGQAFTQLSVVEWGVDDLCFLGINPSFIDMEEVIGNIYEHPHLLGGEQKGNRKNCHQGGDAGQAS